MKETIYEFNNKKLIHSKCKCKLGLVEEENITCVHFPVVSTLLSYLLLNRLSEHILIEMSLY